MESATNNHGYLQNVNGVDIIKDAHVKFWRWNLIMKSYFHLGRLEKALDMLQKLEKVETFEEKYCNIFHSQQLFFISSSVCVEPFVT